MGYGIGNSMLDADRIEDVKRMAEKAKAAGTKLELPVDIVIAQEAKENAETRVVPADQIPDGWEGFDMGPESVKLFSSYLTDAKLVIWNGPFGLFEIKPFDTATAAMAKALAECDGFTIIGGGDSAAAVTQMGFADKIDFISTGGGASLEFLEGKPLPGVTMLDDK